MSPLMYGVVSRHDPHNALESLTPRTQAEPEPGLNITLAQTGCDVEFGSCSWQLWCMTEKTRWWGWKPRNRFKIAHLNATCEYEWSRDINALALTFPLSLSLSLLFITSSFSKHTTPAASQSDLANASQGSNRWIWLPSLSPPPHGYKEIRVVCNAVGNGKGQVVNQPDFFSFALIMY